MSAKLPFLLELGCEELPARSLKPLSEALANGLVAALDAAAIHVDPDDVAIWYTPRRLCVRLGSVAVRQADQQMERRGPAVSAALDTSGAPSKALLGFARSCGVEVDELERESTDKGEWFVWRRLQEGASTASCLGELVVKVLPQLPIVKPMRWGDNSYGFIRPLHWVVALLGSEIVDMELLGVCSGRCSYGHRFHHPQSITLANADGYEAAMRSGDVIVDAKEREEMITAELDRIAAELGAQAVVNPSLVEEVASLTEYPVAVLCSFDRDFLEVPAEALVMAMETHQKFFAMRDAEGKLSAQFVGFANIRSRQPERVQQGYERVIRPRFADARFFYQTDLAQPLAEHQSALERVAYQHKLGSLWDKTQRVAGLSESLARQFSVDPLQARHAAHLSRCDLLTRMVGEFPELQGTMGRYYAKAQGEPEAVACALEEFYAPRFAGDAIASSRLGQLLAVSDRLDTLAGIFAVGMRPSGSKDPFALRRAGLGLARTLIESDLDLDLPQALADACARVRFAGSCTAEELYDFIIDRLRGYFLDQGVNASHFDAVAAVKPASLLDFQRRVLAISDFASRPEAVSLAAANKRIGNILRKSESEVGASIEPQLFELEAEKDLAKLLGSVEREVASAVAAKSYARALERLSELKGPVDRFFEEVMVICEDPSVRRNRLNLLRSVSEQFLAIADISVL